MAVLFNLGAFDGSSFCLVQSNPSDTVTFEHIRGFPEHAWVKARKGWKIPATAPNLGYLFNTFKEEEYTLTDNAKILLQYEKLTFQVESRRSNKRWEYLFEDKATEFECPYAREKYKPFQHQLVAVESMIGAEGFGLLMEMGTGKTLCVGLELNFLACKLRNKEMIRACIVCPASLMTNWERELNMAISDVHDRSIQILKGDVKSIDQLIYLITNPARIKIAILSYDSLDTMSDQIEKFRPEYAAFDESHYVKNYKSQRSKASLRLSGYCSMKRILTGTPVSNNILDLWHQFEILRPGSLGYGTLEGFKREYATVCEYGGFENVTGFNQDKMDKLREDMARLSFVVKKERCLDLPEKMYHTVTVDMPDNIRKMYDEFEREFCTKLDDNTEVSTEFIIVQILKLAQICSGFAIGHKTIVDEDGIIPDEKIKSTVFMPNGDYKLNIMIEDAIEVCKNGKIIIWSRFRLDASAIHNKMKAAGINGGIFAAQGQSADDRQAIVDRFNNDDSFRYICANPKSGGTGLTLLGSKAVPCHTAFFYSNDFSFGQREQAEARNHRIGQTNKVLYRDYAYKNSIEESIAKALQSKKDLADAVKDVGKIRDILLRKDL